MTNTIAADVKRAKHSPSAFVIAIGFCILPAVIFTTLVFAKRGDAGKIKLQGRINPNDVSAVSFARLLGIGIVNEQALVAYREEFIAKGGQGPAFKDCNDLRKVKGLGPVTVRKIEQWLEFK